ncbi:MAG TPA: hypothetical protein VJH68_05385 [Candidatus Nanoarchaeia archaeon]|nr:hypothetical protein [Candidatus Nanoarchaeia archaeon]
MITDNTTIDNTVIDHKPKYSPTEALMVKMLRQAWSDLRQNPSTEAFRTAKEWVHSEEQEYVLSFKYICEHLGLNISQITRQMYNLDKRRSSK